MTRLPLSHYKVNYNEQNIIYTSNQVHIRGQQYNGVYQLRMTDPLLKYTRVQSTNMKSSFLQMSKYLNRICTCTTSLKCVIKTQVKLLLDILFPFTVTDNLDLASEEITFHQNLIDEMIEVIKEFKEIDRYIKNLISRVSLCTKFIGKPFTRNSIRS